MAFVLDASPAVAWALGEPDPFAQTARERVMALARNHNLTVYDSAYLELALRRSLALATLDQHLALSARAEGVAVIGG